MVRPAPVSVSAPADRPRREEAGQCSDRGAAGVCALVGSACGLPGHIDWLKDEEVAAVAAATFLLFDLRGSIHDPLHALCRIDGGCWRHARVAPASGWFPGDDEAEYLAYIGERSGMPASPVVAHLLRLRESMCGFV